MPPSSAFVTASPCPLCAYISRPVVTSVRPRRLRAARPVAPSMLGGSSGDPNSSREPPEGRVITKALEASFRNVWIRLMTRGVSQEYEDAIQAFVVACVAAYKAGYSITALKLELAANETDQKFMGKDISLNEQEKETRLIWITLVYLTLARYRFSSERAPPPAADDLKGTSMERLVNGLAGLVESVCDAAQKGYTLQTFKMELNLKNGADSKPISSAEASIRSQWSRIVFSTFNLLPDSLKGRPS